MSIPTCAVSSTFVAYHFWPTVTARTSTSRGTNQSRGGGETLRLLRPDKSGLAMTSVVVGDWKREDGRGGKESPEGFPSGGGLVVSPSPQKVPQSWGIEGVH